MTAARLIDATLDWLAAASWQLALFIGVVAAATWLLRGASPRLRYGLWSLVLLKALLPTTLGGALLAAPWAVGNWAVRPVEQRLPAAAQEVLTRGAGVEVVGQPAAESAAPHAQRPANAPPHNVAAKALFFAWAAGAVGLLACVIVSYARLVREAQRLPAVDEGPVRVALERAAMAVGVSDTDGVEVRLADRPTGPFLFGVQRPVIVLPQEAVGQLAPDELVGVLAHELVHWRRRDTWVGWVQAVVNALFWFHPLVWWAAARLRDERERCCDDAVLRHAISDRDSYGEAIVRSLTIGRGRPIGLSSPNPLAAAGLVGVFERGATLQQRLEDVMNFRPSRGRFGWRSLATLALFALVFLPMAGSTSAQVAPGDEELVKLSLDDASESGTRVETDTQVKVEGDASTRITTKWATTVCLAEVDAPDVEGAQLVYSAQVKSDLKGTASLEMWAHVEGGSYFSRNPNVAVAGKSDWNRLEIPFLFQEGQRPEKVTLNVIVGGPGTVWVDDVRLAKRPLPGAIGRRRPQPERRVTATKPTTRTAPASSPFPKLVETVPEIGATEVDPSLDELRVTFDRPMGKGMSWTGDSKSDEFPPIDDSRRPRWIDDRTCVLPVRLARGKFYRIGINAKSFQNFQSADGRPAEHRVLAFATAGAKRSVQRKARVPQIVGLSPGNGDGDVDPATTEISVTFDSKMGGGMSWVRTGGDFPDTGGRRARWSKDGRTCTLPVDLNPDTSYQLSLNGSHYTNFQSRSGVPLPALVWSFTTAAGE